MKIQMKNFKSTRIEEGARKECGERKELDERNERRCKWPAQGRVGG